MKLKYQGKTKDVYERNDGRLEFRFKDAATGIVTDEGKIVFDPGQDRVAGKIPGKGQISCAFSTYFFKLLTKKGIPNHYIETSQSTVMLVEPAELLRIPGLYNLEFVYRNNAHGSFLRRYPFVPFCKALHGMVEITTKGETDHLITDEALVELGIMSQKELEQAKKLTREIFSILTDELAKRNLHLIDGKIELGRINGQIKLIDDISPDVLRVCKEARFDENGNCLTTCNGRNVLNPLELGKEFNL